MPLLQGSPTSIRTPTSNFTSLREVPVLLEKLDFRFPLDAGLLHRLAEVIRLRELLGVLDAVPIEQDNNIVRIALGVEDISLHPAFPLVTACLSNKGFHVEKSFTL